MKILESSRVTASDEMLELSPRLAEMKHNIREGKHHRVRDTGTPDLVSECDAEHLSWSRRASRLTRRMCELERAVIEPDERIVFTRTIRKVPPLYSESALRALTVGRTFHELGPISNICADWGMILSEGLLARKQTALSTRERMRSDATAVEFLDCAVETIDAVLGLAGRYGTAARNRGREDVAVILDQVPAFPARTLHEALQFLRICHSVLWLSGHYHCGLGRIDQYLWPYLRDDVEAGRLDYPAAEELLAEFFISLNKDSDLYPGIQQGDNGQSLMLGGVRWDGTDGVNPLTVLVLRVACAVALVDPKINLRVSHDTDIELLALAARLTRLGLGFPQFSNDDVVIPGLVAAGYEIEDARDYSVAACWEFIVPGRGMEVVNIGAASMPSAVDLAIREGLAAGETFEGILDRVQFHLVEQIERLAERSRKLFLPPAPFYSVLMDGCLENGRDLSAGLRYNNFGIHGAASSSAADALAAVKEFVFDQESIEPFRLLRALEDNFANDEKLHLRLREKAPKVGNNDDRADRWLVTLFEMFAEACQAAGENGRGGRYRPGSGSAMYYIWLATGHEGMEEPVVGATADGRKSGEFFSSSLAPSPNVLVQGPLSVLESFGKIDYRRICNGGPLTLELSDGLFRGKDSLRKVGLFVRAFVESGCQQMQLNTLNVETLRDAQRHPERHKNLVVRVWGWSGYFCELDEAYQNQIIGRHVYGL